MIDADFALFNVDQLVTVATASHPQASGDLGVIRRAALAAKDGKIVWFGAMDDIRQQVELSPDATVVNTHGRCVLPGFVDAHTHPVFAGDRTGDFYSRALGASYDQQLRSGGIMHSVEATRAASEETLLNFAFERADTFLRYGTTTIGAKTGYGLTQAAESKCLTVLNRLQRLHPLKVIPTYLAAHVLPDDFEGDAETYIGTVVREWLPGVEGRAAFVDVWVDGGAFTAAQGRHLLQRAGELGFELTAHANEMGYGAGVQMAVELGAASVDHAVYLSDDDVTALAGSQTVAVLLPGTTLFLGSDEYAPARRLIEAGATIAIGTDFNPGTSYTQNMQFILSMAVMKLHLTAEEAIRAATLHGARALRMEDRVGSLEVGKYCDLTVFSVDDYRSIPYQYAMNLVETVVAGGRIVVRDGQVMASAVPATVP
jgi:imidazolonepropionase